MTTFKRYILIARQFMMNSGINDSSPSFDTLPEAEAALDALLQPEHHCIEWAQIFDCEERNVVVEWYQEYKNEPTLLMQQLQKNADGTFGVTKPEDWFKGGDGKPHEFVVPTKEATALHNQIVRDAINK